MTVVNSRLVQGVDLVNPCEHDIVLGTIQKSRDTGGTPLPPTRSRSVYFEEVLPLGNTFYAQENSKFSRLRRALLFGSVGTVPNECTYQL